MKKIAILLGLLMITLQGGCQEPDHEFKVPIYVVKIIFPDGSEQVSALQSASATWESLTGKPSTFPPAAHTHAVTDVDIPSVELQAAIQAMNVILIPKLTTAQIAALSPVAGSLVYDTSLNVFKAGNGTVWKILITNQ